MVHEHTSRMVGWTTGTITRGELHIVFTHAVPSIVMAMKNTLLLHQTTPSCEYLLYFRNNARGLNKRSQMTRTGIGQYQ
jgi:hypothetical protein